MAPDIIRDSTIGQWFNRFTHGHFLPFADQRPHYVLPERYRAALDASTVRDPFDDTAAAASIDESRSNRAASSLHDIPEEEEDDPAGERDPDPPQVVLDFDTGRVSVEHPISPPAPPVPRILISDLDIDKGDANDRAVRPSAPLVKNPFLVEFEDNDPDRPMNWSKGKKSFVASLIAFLTFSVYIGGPIFTPSIPGLLDTFDISPVVATLGLSLFVLAYGIGPMFLAPLQEMPRQGRTPVYIIGLLFFFLFQFPIVFAPNMATILVFRFASGFVGSPAIATGGASMFDLFGPRHAPIAIGVWSIGAVSGPVLGPVIVSHDQLNLGVGQPRLTFSSAFIISKGSFAAQAKGWTWPNWELMWISGFAFLVLSFLLPETLESTILIRRAERLRLRTGDSRFRTQAEIDAIAGETFIQLARSNLKRAFQLTAEPAVLFANSYTALVYACFYLWFEAFPILYNETYRFSLGISGLPYLAFIVSGVITFALYVVYVVYHLNPRMDRPGFVPEARLEIGVIAGLFIPVSLLMFGWAGEEETHWIVPTIGAGLYLPGIFLIFQCILVYISSSYPPALAGSILAGNDLFRSSFASMFPLFGAYYFNALGLGVGCSVLAGLTFIMVPLLYLLIRAGPSLRAKSKWIQ
ncbi:BZ3500_MvSof-1268-A1-R1_Chr8-1g09792 [Microbotryum saponariae]|uniref:BZ3500_MvSof-1268-A1-R1_Chr8-1g09792 protein n=1 Tax=Microbotryum saponariae TaxID=289078 RepID=A0A2X0LRH0_9BASI|nr:BZ3500_MvSof-1268-A1-R1_Chr8-1g09792 [Microbotryum saponariae]SDA08078.1 BZ3501_MvSof-1269-A2-R1_Chr8-1g09515 [Microbotryum saponariae]